MAKIKRDPLSKYAEIKVARYPNFVAWGYSDSEWIVQRQGSTVCTLSIQTRRERKPSASTPSGYKVVTHSLVRVVYRAQGKDIEIDTEIQWFGGLVENIKAFLEFVAVDGLLNLAIAQTEAALRGTGVTERAIFNAWDTWLGTGDALKPHKEQALSNLIRLMEGAAHGNDFRPD